MNKKIVFFDIDGTILDHDKEIPSSTKEAILKLKENGVYVAIATGRGPFMFKAIKKELGIETFASFNGQYVVFENEVIYKNPFPMHDLHNLYQQAVSNEHPIVFMNEEMMKANVDYHVSIETGMNSLHMPIPLKDEDFYKSGEIYQALLFCEEADEHKYIDNLTNLHFIRWHQVSTDVLPMGGSKAKGIQKIMENLDFKTEDVYAFGDGLNDIEMFKSVGTAVAMGNARPEVKQHADFITTDVGENGIWNGLKELSLI